MGRIRSTTNQGKGHNVKRNWSAMETAFTFSGKGLTDGSLLLEIYFDTSNRGYHVYKISLDQVRTGGTVEKILTFVKASQHNISDLLPASSVRSTSGTNATGHKLPPSASGTE